MLDKKITYQSISMTATGLPNGIGMNISTFPTTFITTPLRG
jgi:hypothetical protein